MITVALLKELGFKGFVTTVEVTYARRCSSETLRYAHSIGGTSRDIAVEEREINYRKTGNFRVVQFSRNFAVSISPRKLKSAKYFPSFEN